MAKQRINDAQGPSVNRQNNTTNVATTPRIETGWGFIQGNGAGSGVIAETVTFGTAFTAAPVVMIAPLNGRSGSDPSAISDFSAGAEDVTWSIMDVTSSSFSARAYKPSTLISTVRFGYAWIAIGV